MKKLFILFFLSFILFAQQSFGQAFQQDTKIIAVGLGVGSSLGGFGHTSQMPGISIQYEQGMWEVGGPGVISLGGYLGYKSFGSTTKAGNFESKSRWNYSIVGVRSAYHYQGIANEKLDLYGGLMLSYNILNYSYSDNSGFSMGASGANYGSTAGFTMYLGGRYYLTDNLGIYSELGYGVSFLNVGGVFRF